MTFKINFEFLLGAKSVSFSFFHLVENEKGSFSSFCTFLESSKKKRIFVMEGTKILSNVEQG